MKAQDLAGIHDILPLPQPPLISATWVIAMALVFAAGIAAYWLWRYSRPINRIYRDLLKRRISPREAAHRLAARPRLPQTLRSTLDQWRFSRQPPDAQRLLALIEALRHGR